MNKTPATRKKVRIQGITIELNGDSTKLEASLKSVNSEIRNTESKLKDVNKLLKMDPGNTNLLLQKYKTLQTEIKATKEMLPVRSVEAPWSGYR